jgi:hypothetical protein
VNKNHLSDEDLLQFVTAVVEHGSQHKAAEALGVAQSTVHERLKEAKQRRLFVNPTGSIEVLESKILPIPPKGQKAVYFLTCAQNNTKLHEDWWNNLLALVEHDSATLMVSTVMYNKDALGQRANAKSNAPRSREAELAAEYDHRLIPYIRDERVRLARNLTFCSELNVIPTAVNPLEGLANYTHRESTIVPHPKLAMESVPTMKSEGVKLMYTTGAVTQRNYIKRKVGYQAEHFHTYGALIVEVDDRGHWYARQVVHGPDGRAYDLDRCAYKGKVTTGHRIADLCVEVHADKVDKDILELVFGKQPTSIMETLRPEGVHVHDLLDFSGRSHHTRKDPYEVYRAVLEGRWELTGELKRTADILWNKISRPWTHVVVVNSNHDRHLEIFLKTMDWRLDPVNAEMILALNLVVLQGIKAGRKVNLTDVALNLGFDKIETNGAGTNGVLFLAEDESDVILGDFNGGIECGLHADRGANGAKGNLRGIAKVDRAMNVGDKHVTAIINHLYCCGFIGLLDQGYNHGLSSWTHAVTATYKNATRAIISMWKGKWHA